MKGYGFLVEATQSTCDLSHSQGMLLQYGGYRSKFLVQQGAQGVLRSLDLYYPKSIEAVTGARLKARVAWAPGVEAEYEAGKKGFEFLRIKNCFFEPFLFPHSSSPSIADSIFDLLSLLQYAHSAETLYHGSASYFSQRDLSLTYRELRQEIPQDEYPDRYLVHWSPAGRRLRVFDDLEGRCFKNRLESLFASSICSFLSS